MDERIELAVKGFARALQRPERICVLVDSWMQNICGAAGSVADALRVFVDQMMIGAMDFRIENEAVHLLPTPHVNVYYRNLDARERKLLAFMISRWQTYFCKITPGEYDDARPTYHGFKFNDLLAAEFKRVDVCLCMFAMALKHALELSSDARLIDGSYFRLWGTCYAVVVERLFDQRYAAFCTRAFDLLLNRQMHLRAWDPAVRTLP